MALTGRRRILEKKDLALRPHPGARRTTRLAESSVVHPNPKPPHRPDATDKSRPSGTDLETFGRLRPAFGVGAGSTPRSRTGLETFGRTLPRDESRSHRTPVGKGEQRTGNE